MKLIPGSILFAFPITAVVRSGVEGRVNVATGNLNNNNISNFNVNENILPKWQSVIPDTNYVILLSSSDDNDNRNNYTSNNNNTIRWKLESDDKVYTNLTGHVPGDLLTDLIIEGIIDDPYVDRNFLTQRHVWMGGKDTASDNTNNSDTEYAIRARTRTWIYSTTLLIDDSKDKDWTWQLVIEGVKMGATISFNNIYLGTVTDQFLRYRFTVHKYHLSGGKRIKSTETIRQHTLTITFDPSIEVDGRYTACSGGWDWALYGREVDIQGKQIFTLGIVKPIYLIAVQQYSVTHVVPKIYYQGEYPTKPLLNGPENDFIIQMNIHLQFLQSVSLTSPSSAPTAAVSIVVHSSDLGKFFVLPAKIPKSLLSRQNNTKKTIGIKNSDTEVEKMISFKISASKDIVKLWWPNGMGGQPLYNIFVGLTKSNSHNDDDNATGYSTNINIGTAMKSSWGIQKRVGFRISALVTTNETNNTVLPEVLNSNNNNNNRDVSDNSTTDKEGSGQHGMYFRINGAVLMARGANFIPMDQLEGRLTDRSHKIAVQSAAAANMNMLRVWGGGMILPDIFYDTCDEVGILLYHDMMFVEEEGHGPPTITKTASKNKKFKYVNYNTINSPTSLSVTAEKEIRYIVRTLIHHPSIIVWNGCNECAVIMGTPTEIYAKYVMKFVSEEDNTRSIWPSSPSKHGWKTGVSTSDSRPNGNSLSSYDTNDFPRVLETHGPYQRSYSKSYPGVDGMNVGFPYENTPPLIKQVDIGLSFPNVFSSEFGSSVMSSFESMTGTLNPEFWSLHGDGYNNNIPPDTCKHYNGNKNSCTGGNVMAERNYPCDSHILAYFGNNVTTIAALNKGGKLAFQGQLYHCLISQTLWMKGEIEKRRSTNSFGLLIWQMNENWPTGGWGVIEYGTDTTKYRKSGDINVKTSISQVVGGRWKPLMHLLESTLFRDIIAVCGNEDKSSNTSQCYLRNDGMDEIIDVVIRLEAWSLRGMNPNKVLTYNISSLKAGHIFWFSIPPEIRRGNDVIFIHVIQDPHHSSSNYLTDDMVDATEKKIVYENVFLWNMPKHIIGLREDVFIEIQSVHYITGNNRTSEAISVTFKADYIALYVVLTTRAQGRFLENAFALRPMEVKTVEFMSLVSGGKIDFDLFKSTLRVEHLGSYISSPSPAVAFAITS